MTRIPRPCNICEENFTPTGKYSWTCDECTQKAIIKATKKRDARIRNQKVYK